MRGARQTQIDNRVLAQAATEVTTSNQWDYFDRYGITRNKRDPEVLRIDGRKSVGLVMANVDLFRPLLLPPGRGAWLPNHPFLLKAWNCVEVVRALRAEEIFADSAEMTRAREIQRLIVARRLEGVFRWFLNDWSFARRVSASRLTNSRYICVGGCATFRFSDHGIFGMVVPHHRNLMRDGRYDVPNQHGLSSAMMLVLNRMRGEE